MGDSLSVLSDAKRVLKKDMENLASLKNQNHSNMSSKDGDDENNDDTENGQESLSEDDSDDDSDRKGMFNNISPLKLKVESCKICI